MSSSSIETRARGLEPFFFGSESSLFGCCDLPRRPAAGSGVVLCYPIGHEYVASHRALRQLAQRLADRGHPALRFDYYGTGDSAGDEEGWSLERWRSDVAEAIDELRARSRCPGITLVGIGIGAALSAMVAPSRREVEAVALWDPVVEGAAYVDRIFAQHEAISGRAPALGKNGALELLGFPLSKGFLRELDSLDLTSRAVPAERVLVIETAHARGGETYAGFLRGRGARVDYVRLKTAAPEVEQLDGVSVPAKVLEAVATWMEAER